MSTLIYLDRILDKEFAKMSPLEKTIIIVSASDEDLANEAAKQLEELQDENIKSEPD